MDDARDLLLVGVDMVEQRLGEEIARWKASEELGAPFAQHRTPQEEAHQDGGQQLRALAVDSEDEEALALFPDSIDWSWGVWKNLLLVPLEEAVAEHSEANPFQHEPFHIAPLCKDQVLLDRWDRMVRRPERCKIDARHDVEEEVLSGLPWLLQLHW